MAKKRNIEGQRLYHFELSDKNRTVRWVLIIVFLIIAAVAIVAGLMSALQTPAGWQAIKASSTQLDCSDQFVFQYDLGSGTQSATQENKELSLLYGQLCQKAWQLFYHEAGQTDVNGLWQINRYPNEEVTVDPALYRAFAVLEESGSRVLYLGPVYAAYDQVFYSTDEFTAADNDPSQDPETRAYVATLAAFANDPEAVNLKLMGENRVVLQVNQTYLSYLQENQVERLLDFGWVRNAAIADYMATALQESGYTNGYIASIDGFTRNLDSRGTGFDFNLFNKSDDAVDLAAVMHYSGPMSIISLRSYPMYQEDSERYYCYADGRTVTAMIDPFDGQSKSAVDNLVAYASDRSCLSLAASMMPLFIADTFRQESVLALEQIGIYSIWFEGKQLQHNQSDIALTIKDTRYTAQLAE